MVPHYLLSVALARFLPSRGRISRKTFSKKMFKTTNLQQRKNRKAKLSNPQQQSKAADRTRTDDLVLTKDVLYQLSYSSRYRRYGRPPLPLAVKISPVHSCHTYSSRRGKPCMTPKPCFSNDHPANTGTTGRTSVV